MRKLTLASEEALAYSGQIVARTPNSVVVEARFTRFDRVDLGYVVFERNDRFVEYFYSDRWYNIFEVHAAADDRLKGWYCNITRPALIEDGRVSAVDLALDVFVYPDGRTLVLDEEEFAVLPIGADERAKARAGLDDLMRLIDERREVFEAIG